MIRSRLKLSKEYTIEELFEYIKGIQFEAGKPSMVNYGPTKWIVFSEHDWYNRIVIGGSKGKFEVQCKPIDINEMYTSLGKKIGLLIKRSGFFSEIMEKTKKKSETLIASIVLQINEMNL